jgi:colicin import membrane protein
VSLDGKIDDLYRQPLDAFVTARNALAKTVTGDDAKRVRALVKPTVVPWAVNQVYWQARATYDRLIKSGERLRAAQIASLEGRRGADVREAGDAHRKALADAVKAAERIAAAAAANPPADALMRTFETLSLASEPPEPPGRLTKPLQPSGFEALAGVTPLARPAAAGAARPFPASARSEAERASAGPDKKRTEADRRKERAAEEAARKREAAIKAAAAALARAEAAEQLARTAWERTHDKLLEARQALTHLKSSKSEV